MIGLGLPGGPLRALCLGAHPDDIEIGCGGTLLSLCASRDVQATVVVATGTVQRHAEATKAAAGFLPGADLDLHLFDLPDGRLPAHWDAVKDVLEGVAAAQTAGPDVIFAPRSDDAHQDHRVVADLTTTVWRNSLVLRYEIPKWDGDLGRTTHYVRLDPQIARRKVDLLTDSYPSQFGRDWWGDDTFLSLMRLRGVECRSSYAEAFVVDKAVLTW